MRSAREGQRDFRRVCAGLGMYFIHVTLFFKREYIVSVALTAFNYFRFT